jgi:hypothetical protein
MIGAHAQHISLAGTAQRHFDVTDAMNAVGSHPGEGDISQQRTLDHGQARAGFVANSTVSGTWALARRSRSSVQAFGR